MERVIYVAGIDRESFAYAARTVPYWLLSAGYLKNLPLWILPYLTDSTREVLWDPGTFTISEKRRLTFEQYCNFVRYHDAPNCRWLSYDVIGDPLKSLRYWQLMQEKGFSVVPVYHHGMPEEILEMPDVAIGGLVPLKHNRSALFEYLTWVFTEHKIAGRTHLLGMQDLDIFEAFPASSGDSTSWLRSLKFKEGKSVEVFLRQYGKKIVSCRPVQTTVGSMLMV